MAVRIDPDGPGPMGPRRTLSKPVIAGGVAPLETIAEQIAPFFAGDDS